VKTDHKSTTDYCGDDFHVCNYGGKCVLNVDGSFKECDCSNAKDKQGRPKSGKACQLNAVTETDYCGDSFHVCQYGGICLYDAFGTFRECDCQYAVDDNGNQMLGPACTHHVDDTQSGATSFCGTGLYGDVTCENGGVCLRHDSVESPGDIFYTCDCSSTSDESGNPYAGKKCHLQQSNTPSGPNSDSFCPKTICKHGGDCVSTTIHCLNGGTCKDDTSVHMVKDEKQEEYCNCPEGWGGPTCEAPLEYCGDKYHHCLNGSTCVLKKDMGHTKAYACECVTTNNGVFAGTHCEHQAAVSCHANGSMADAKASGSFCTTHGKCLVILKPGDAQKHQGCVCENGWEGDHCEHRAGTAPKPSRSSGGNGSQISPIEATFVLVGLLGAAAGIGLFVLQYRRRQSIELKADRSAAAAMPVDLMLEADGSTTMSSGQKSKRDYDDGTDSNADSGEYSAPNPTPPPAEAFQAIPPNTKEEIMEDAEIV